MKGWSSNQESWLFCASGEDTALLTWLEFPDCNTRLKSGLSASCVPAESTRHLYSKHSQIERTGWSSAVVGLANAIIQLREITMH